MKTKRLLVLAIATIASTAIFAQSKTTFGVRAGVNFYNLTGKNSGNDDLENKIKVGFNAGVNAEIPVGIDFFVQPGLLFSTKGAKSKNIDQTTSLSYVELPVNLIYKPELGEGKMLLGFGPYVAYGVGGKYELSGVETDIEFGNDLPSELKPFDAGANLLVGYEFSNNFSFQLNASLGMINLYNRPAGDTKSKIKNTGFGLSLGYRF